MKKTALIIGGVVALLASFYGGWSLAAQSIKPEIITEIEYVDRPIYPPMTFNITETIEVPINPRPFDSVDELKTWLAQDDTDTTTYIYPETVFPYDCEDYAIALMRNAIDAGYEISLDLDIKGDRWHLRNLTIINGEYWTIEPMTDEVDLWGYTD